VNLRKSILYRASEVKCIAGAKKYRGVQLLKRITRMPNNVFRHCEPVPKARTLIILKLFPHSGCLSYR